MLLVAPWQLGGASLCTLHPQVEQRRSRRQTGHLHGARAEASEPADGVPEVAAGAQETQQNRSQGRRPGQEDWGGQRQVPPDCDAAGAPVPVVRVVSLEEPEE